MDTITIKASNVDQLLKLRDWADDTSGDRLGSRNFFRDGITGYDWKPGELEIKIMVKDEAAALKLHWELGEIESTIGWRDLEWD